MSSRQIQRSSVVSQPSRSLSGYGIKTNSLSDTELIKFVNKLKDEIRLLKLENEMLEKAIMRLEPSLMHGVYQALECVIKRNSSSSLNMDSFIKIQPSKFGHTESLFCSLRLKSNPSRASSRKSSGRISENVIYSSARINVLEMNELLSVEIDIQNTNLENVRNRAAKQYSYLNAQLEEIEIRVSDTEKAGKLFKQDVLIDGWDKIAQRIPAEIWIRFITDCVKRTDRQIDKLRLRTSTFNALYRKFKGQMKAKADLSENLRPVDFDKIKIDNSECEKLIEQKMQQIEESKKLTGDANLNLAIHKEALMEQNNYLTKVIMTTKNKEQLTVKLDKERDLIQIQADILSQKLDEVRKIRRAHQVPDVMDYVEVKWLVTGLKHAIKILENRAQIHQSALTTVNKNLQTLVSEMEMKNSIKSI